MAFTPPRASLRPLDIGRRGRSVSSVGAGAKVGAHADGASNRSSFNR